MLNGNINKQKGAHASANLFSLIESAKLHELNPFENLTHIFKEMLEVLPMIERDSEVEKLRDYVHLSIEEKNTLIISLGCKSEVERSAILFKAFHAEAPLDLRGIQRDIESERFSKLFNNFEETIRAAQRIPEIFNSFYSKIPNKEEIAIFFIISLLLQDKNKRLDILVCHFKKGGLKYIEDISTAFSFQDFKSFFKEDIYGDVCQDLTEELLFMSKIEFNSYTQYPCRDSIWKSGARNYMKILNSFPRETQGFILTKQPKRSLEPLLEYLGYESEAERFLLFISSTDESQEAALKKLDAIRSISSLPPMKEPASMAISTPIKVNLMELIGDFNDEISYESLEKPFIAPSGRTLNWITFMSLIKSDVITDPFTRETYSLEALRANLIVIELKKHVLANNLIELKEALICSLTKKQFEDPVVTQDGKTYERQALLTYLEKSGNRLPVSDIKVDATEITSIRDGKYKNLFVTQVIDIIKLIINTEEKRLKDSVSDKKITATSTLNDYITLKLIPALAADQLSLIEELSNSSDFFKSNVGALPILHSIAQTDYFDKLIYLLEKVPLDDIFQIDNHHNNILHAILRSKNIKICEAVIGRLIERFRKAERLCDFVSLFRASNQFGKTPITFAKMFSEELYQLMQRTFVKTESLAKKDSGKKLSIEKVHVSLEKKLEFIEFFIKAKYKKNKVIMKKAIAKTSHFFQMEENELKTGLEIMIKILQRPEILRLSHFLEVVSNDKNLTELFAKNKRLVDNFNTIVEFWKIDEEKLDRLSSSQQKI